jgi:coenzyme F420-reducing hydrogenase beta subunit
MHKEIFKGDLNQCYGCQACKQICPTNCIKMQPNNEGFIFPSIDNSKCINCGLCESVCPVNINILAKTNNVYEQNTYAAWNKNIAERMSSSSGGVFPAIAARVIKNGGVVYGCAWQKDKLTAQQIRIDREEDILMLKGSKYVQSSTANTYSEVKSDIKIGLTVLYSGTPCQIAGLKLYLKEEYDNLITIDLICHGTPSPKMLDAYVEYVQKKENSKISNLKFRNKKKSGWRSWVSYLNIYKNKTKFLLIGSSPYMYGFNKGYFNRESCHLCKFTIPKRVSDITLADYWGVAKFHPELYNEQKYGLSLIICNTSKGLQSVNKSKHVLELRESKMEYAIAGNHSLSKQNERSKVRNYAFEDLEQKGFEYMAKTYLKPNYLWIHELIPSIMKNAIKLLKHRFQN